MSKLVCKKTEFYVTLQIQVESSLRGAHMIVIIDFLAKYDKITFLYRHVLVCPSIIFLT